MQEALQQFSGGEWNLQMEALNTIRSLSLFHSELLKGQPGGVSQLHAIMLQGLALCDSLRSTLAKSALMCVEGNLSFVTSEHKPAAEQHSIACLFPLKTWRFFLQT